MATYAIVCTNPTVIDGHKFNSGATIGKLETNLPWDNVFSVLRNAMVSVVREEDAPKVEEPKTPPPPLSIPTEPQANEPENLLPSKQEAAAVDTEDDLNLDPLAGLTPKLAESLREALVDGKISPIGSLDTPDKVQAAIDSGFDLASLDGIGPKAVQKIKDWLLALKGE